MEGFLMGGILLGGGLFMYWLVERFTRPKYNPKYIYPPQTSFTSPPGTVHYTDLINQPQIIIHSPKETMSMNAQIKEDNTRFPHRFEGKGLTDKPEHVEKERTGVLIVMRDDGNDFTFAVTEKTYMSGAPNYRYPNEPTYWSLEWKASFFVNEDRIVIKQEVHETTLYQRAYIGYAITWNGDRPE